MSVSSQRFLQDHTQCCLHFTCVDIKWDVCIIIDRVNRNFGRGGSALNRIRLFCSTMVHVCCVPGCRTHLAFFTLRLKNKSLLNRWVNLIGRTNLPINHHTRICSRHFVNAKGRRLYSDEVLSLCLPKSSITTPVTRRKPPKDRSVVLSGEPFIAAEEMIVCGEEESEEHVDP